MEIVEDRYGAGSTLITSQLPVEAWHEVIGEPTFADPSSIASFTTPPASRSKGRPCESLRRPHPTAHSRHADRDRSE